MGSIDKACISGFLCRLCSEMHRIVIHIYGDQGKRLSLVEKINGYLPITISPTDPLPKTICETCLRRVEQHYDLLVRLSRIKEKRFLRTKRPLPNTDEVSDMSGCSSDDEWYSETNRATSTVRTSPTTLATTSTSSSAAIRNRVTRAITPTTTTTSTSFVFPPLQAVSIGNPPEHDAEHND